MLFNIETVIIMLITWIASMIHMYRQGHLSGWQKGNEIGISHTFTVLEKYGIMGEKEYEKLAKSMRKK